MEITVGWIVFSLFIAWWAHVWGRAGPLYFIFALFLSPLIAAIILAAVGRDPILEESQMLAQGKLKKCPDCAELIQADANICKHCGKEQETVELELRDPDPTAVIWFKKSLKFLGNLIVFLAAASVSLLGFLKIWQWIS